MNWIHVIGLLAAQIAIALSAIFLFRNRKNKTGLEERETERIKTERRMQAEKAANEAAVIREQIELERQLAARHASEELARQEIVKELRKQIKRETDDELLDRLIAVLRMSKNK